MTIVSSRSLTRVFMMVKTLTIWVISIFGIGTLNSFLSNTSSLNEGWRNTAVPFVRVAYLLEKICEHIGYTQIFPPSPKALNFKDYVSIQ